MTKFVPGSVETRNSFQRPACTIDWNESVSTLMKRVSRLRFLLTVRNLPMQAPSSGWSRSCATR